jgi:hypothetical protein
MRCFHSKRLWVRTFHAGQGDLLQHLVFQRLSIADEVLIRASGRLDASGNRAKREDDALKLARLDTSDQRVVHTVGQ